MSIEEYLDMDDQDYKHMNGLNIGGSSADPFQDLDGNDDEEEEEEHHTLEYLTDEDEPSQEIDLGNLFLDENTPL